MHILRPHNRPSNGHSSTSRSRSRSRPLRHRRAEAGQATAEYALVMLAAAAIAGLLLAWVAGTDGIGRLLDAVMDSLISETT